MAPTKTTALAAPAQTEAAAPQTILMPTPLPLPAPAELPESPFTPFVKTATELSTSDRGGSDEDRALLGMLGKQLSVIGFLSSLSPNGFYLQPRDIRAALSVLAQSGTASDRPERAARRRGLSLIASATQLPSSPSIPGTMTPGIPEDPIMAIGRYVAAVAPAVAAAKNAEAFSVIAGPLNQLNELRAAFAADIAELSLRLA